MAKQLEILIKVGHSDMDQEQRARDAVAIGEKICQSLVGDPNFVENRIVVNYDTTNEVYIAVCEECTLHGLEIPCE